MAQLRSTLITGSTHENLLNINSPILSNILTVSGSGVVNINGFFKTNYIYDITNTTGSTGQVLSTTNAGVQWVTASSPGGGGG
jgi:hypothetical protein